MVRPITPCRSDGDTHGGTSSDVPTWTNVLITDDMPVQWATDAGEPEAGDELAGRLIIGTGQQLIIDLCGAAATNLMAALFEAHHEARMSLPACPSRADPNVSGGLG